MRRFSDAIVVLILLILAIILYQEAPSHSPISLVDISPLAIAEPVSKFEKGEGPNLALASGPLTSVHWWREGISAKPNAAAAPDGTMTADRLVETGDFGRHRAGTSLTGTDAGEVSTLSLYVKAAERRVIQMEMADRSTGKYGLALFDLDRKAVVTEVRDVTDAGMEELPGGWFRCWVAMPFATNSITFNFALSDMDAPSLYRGNTADGLLVWGVQFEAGNRPREYAGPKTVKQP